MSNLARETATEPGSTRAGLLHFGSRRTVSALWLFAILNYLYCDVLGSHDPEYMRDLINDGGSGGVEMTPGLLLSAAILMTIPMVSVLLSRIASHGLARWSSVVSGIVMTLVQVATLFVGTTTTYYLYFSVIEIATTATIVVIAWRWRVEN